MQAGYLLDPRDCHFDPARLQCQAGQAAGTCLSAPQVAEAQRLYSPVTDPRTGLHLYPGFARGSESQWSLIQGALVPFYAQPLLANAVFDNPNWDWTTFNFDSDAALVDRVLSPVINATSPDLSRFQAHGGKLLMTQGWADALNAQTLPIEYFNSVLAVQLSLDRTRDFFRLYMAPGMSHCGGGPGPEHHRRLGAADRPHAAARRGRGAAGLGGAGPRPGRADLDQVRERHPARRGARDASCVPTRRWRASRVATRPRPRAMPASATTTTSRRTSGRRCARSSSICASAILPTCRTEA